MDKRFVEPTRRAFQEATGLKPTDYWHEAQPGGASNEMDPLGENFAASNGATVFGWQAHGDNCGGQPEVDNKEIKIKLDAVIKEKMNKFPNARHFSIFATEQKIDIKEINTKI